jgi:glutamate-1-semialdehyde aminotransferase
VIDRASLGTPLSEERERFAAAHPRSAAAHAQAERHLLGGVPMPWMSKWAGGFPVYLAEAHEARVVDLDGHEYADLCLGDTGAMAGHSPAPTVAAVRDRFETHGGATVMLPTEDVGGVGGTLAGNALSLAAARATLAEVLTGDAFARMTALQERFTAGVRATIARHDLPWCVVELGARAEYHMALMSPATTEAEVDRHTEAFADAVAALVA